MGELKFCFNDQCVFHQNIAGENSRSIRVDNPNRDSRYRYASSSSPLP